MRCVKGMPLEGIAVGASLDQRHAVRYFACPIRTGRNPQNGRAFLDFLRSDAARHIYLFYGFTPAEG